MRLFVSQSELFSNCFDRYSLRFQFKHFFFILLYVSVTSCHNKTSYGFHYTIGGLFCHCTFFMVRFIDCVNGLYFSWFIQAFFASFEALQDTNCNRSLFVLSLEKYFLQIILCRPDSLLCSRVRYPQRCRRVLIIHSLNGDQVQNIPIVFLSFLRQSSQVRI